MFYRLNRTLLLFVNERLGVLPERPTSISELLAVGTSRIPEIRAAFLEHRELIQPFVEENPDRLSAAELDIVRSWQHLVSGKFLIFRERKKHTISLTTDDETLVYGVLALNEPFTAMIRQPLPVMLGAVLLREVQELAFEQGLIPYFPADRQKEG